jgi:hypothetical protein
MDARNWRVCFRSCVDGEPLLQRRGLTKAGAERMAAWMTSAYGWEHYAEPDVGPVAEEPDDG